MHNVDTNKLAEEINRQGTWVNAVKSEMGKVVVGQDQLVDRLLIGSYQWSRVTRGCSRVGKNADSELTCRSPGRGVPTHPVYS